MDKSYCKSQKMEDVNVAAKSSNWVPDFIIILMIQKLVTIREETERGKINAAERFGWQEGLE
jgi:hypothetical protein